jgi:hypothetical protein
MPMIMAAIFNTPHGKMALITDEELVGRSRFDQESGMILMVPEHLYSKGRLVSENEAEQIMKAASILVLTGERSVSLAVKLGLAHPDSVVKIKGIPHVYVYKISYAQD